MAGRPDQTVVRPIARVIVVRIDHLIGAGRQVVQRRARSLLHDDEQMRVDGQQRESQTAVKIVQRQVAGRRGIAIIGNGARLVAEVRPHHGRIGGVTPRKVGPGGNIPVLNVIGVGKEVAARRPGGGGVGVVKPGWKTTTVNDSAVATGQHEGGRPAPLVHTQDDGDSLLRGLTDDLVHGTQILFVVEVGHTLVRVGRRRIGFDIGPGHRQADQVEAPLGQFRIFAGGRGGIAAIG